MRDKARPRQYNRIMAYYPRIGIIYNPNSTGDSRNVAERLAEQLKSHYQRNIIKLIPTEHAGHAEELAYKLAMKYKNPLIISSSGDGGYHEVVNGAVRAQAEGAKPVCAVLPAGNANDHHGDVATQPLERAIIKGSVTRIDLLKIEIRSGRKASTRYGHSYIGLGLTPTVAIELNRQSLSALKELLIVVRSFYRFQPFKIEAEGRTLELDSLIISNIGRMAKVLNLHRSRLDDGVFEVTIFPHGHKLQLLRRLFMATTKGLRPDISTKRYKFIAMGKMPIQIDGEVTEVAKDDVVIVTGAKQLLRTLL